MSNIKKILVAVIIMSLFVPTIAFGAEWKQDEKGWWYQNDDGSYPVNQWQEIEGKQYYFGGDGYMLSNTVTPDGYRVDADGVWVQTQSVSNINYTADSVTTDLSISDYIYENTIGDTIHIFEVTNNSQHTLEIIINETAKNSSGNVIGANSTSQEDISAGCTVFIINYFNSVTGVTSFDTSIQTKIEGVYVPVLQNIKIESSNVGNKVIVTATNNGSVAAKFPEATAVFFRNGKVVYYNSAYLSDGDYELKPGAVLSMQIESYKPYDSVKVHLTARRSKWD